jgi:hypothetical protein
MVNALALKGKARTALEGRYLPDLLDFPTSSPPAPGNLPLNRRAPPSNYASAITSLAVSRLSQTSREIVRGPARVRQVERVSPWGGGSDVVGLAACQSHHWRDDPLLQPEVRAAFQRLLAENWTDAPRQIHPNVPLWMFWVDPRNRWPSGKGPRLDHVPLTPDLAERLIDAGVARWRAASTGPTVTRAGLD